MKKKIIIIISSVLLLGLICYFIIFPIKKKDEYKALIPNLETSISELNDQIANEEAKQKDYKASLQTYETMYKQLNNNDCLYDFFNECDIYATRANCLIEATSYNANFFGVITSKNAVSGMGTVIDSSDDYYFILSTYDYLVKQKNYQSVKYIVKDAFMQEYNASLVYESEDFNLAILAIKKGNSDLYAMKLSNASLKEKMLTCAIYQGTTNYNHMCFNTLTYNETKDTYYFEIDTNDTARGAMLVGDGHQLLGILASNLGNKYEIIEASTILAFLNSLENGEK